ncbi:hypothetical protein K8R04_02790 [Candidatus Uhrbacteria bacterium]|nr:hypothetical protein [Candidatus Uhrbacteria bacterium]
MSVEKRKWREVNEKQADVPSIYDLPVKKLLGLALWCLYVSKHHFDIEYLTYDQIENILVGYFDIPIKLNSLKKAIAPAIGTKIIKSKSDAGVKISNSAENHLKSLRKDGLLNVVCIDPKRPREAQQNLRQLVRSIPKGELLICDPYYGVNTLDVLEEFAKHHKKIRFLTRQPGSREKKSALATAVSQFKKQYGTKVELFLTTTRDFHDRYILSSDRFLIIGHGLMDIGSKESLIVMIPDQFGKDIRKTLISSFNGRWTSATSL